MPLGGAGAGSLELGPDAWLRCLRINNNRRPGEEIPRADHTFLALRVAQANTTYARLLQLPARDAADPARHADAPPPLPPKGLGWRALYPVASYAVLDPDCPVRVVWTAFSPIIPFDYDASILPLALFGVRCENTSADAATVSVLLNVESFLGRPAAGLLPVPAPGGPVLALEEQPKLVVQTGRRSHLPMADPDVPPQPNAVEMGTLAPPEGIAPGQYCVAARPAVDMAVSVFAWDLHETNDEAALWRCFLADGHLAHAQSASTQVTAGAACLQFTLAPGEVRRADFAWAWFSPRDMAHGVDQGVGYANRLKGAAEVAKLGLRNVDYYYASVEGWRGRLKNSTLPRWLNDALINSSHVLSTNTVFTREGRFGLLEGEEDRRSARLDLRRYTSLGVLLFFPRFEEQTLLTIANAEDLLHEKRFPAHLGEDGLHHPDFRDVDGLQLDLICEFILSAYRNYHCIGNLARLKALAPRLHEAITLAMGRDNDGDGLPEVAPLPRTYDGIALHGLNVITCGLWLAALRAYARIAEFLRQPEEAARCLAMARRAEKSFEQYFWDDARSYYRLAYDSRLPREAQPPEFQICHSAQLTGQWQADFLGLGTLHDRARIARALATIAQVNEREHGLLSAVLPDGSSYHNPDTDPQPAAGHAYWPCHTAAHYACLQIQRGEVEAGLRALEKTWQQHHHRQQRLFDQPNLVTDFPGPELDVLRCKRFAGALSLWYVLYAITGLDLSLAEKRIRIAPRLPQGTHTLETLLFTPTCLGWLRYQVDPAPYRQRLNLSLDSPITLQQIELRVPLDVRALRVRCELPDGAFECTHHLEPDTGAQRLILRAARPVIANTALSIEVTAT